MLIRTPRLTLEPISLAMAEAVMLGRREDAERVAEARLPPAWPNRALIERAFTASLEEIRADPATRLWGDRLVIVTERGEKSERAERRVVGSIVFHGKPAGDGLAEMAYGVEDGSQGQGIATEATSACVRWALAQEGVVAVRATTLPWHRASLRVIQKLGMTQVGTRDHEVLGELLVFEVRGDRVVPGYQRTS
jgi:[ribosomal protein S5]-alanine N-acetyltransferase